MTKMQMIVVGVFAMVCAPAAAQIDYRVPGINENREGRALDANPQFGAAGLNQNQFSQQIYSFDYGLRSSNIITGNISGLGRFQGSSPILANNAFRVSLPSSGLADFRSTSVGLPDVARGYQTYGVGSYYDPSIIITDAGAISRGLNAPGSSQLISPYQAPPLPSQRSPSDSALLADPAYLNSPQRSAFSPGVRQTDFGAASASSPLNLASSPSPYSAAAASSIFGTPSLTNLNSLTLNPAQSAALAQNSPLAPRVPGQLDPTRRSPAENDLSGNPQIADEERPLTGLPYPEADPLAQAVRTAQQRPANAPGGGTGMNASSAGGPFTGSPALVPGVTQTLITGDRFNDLASAFASAQAKAGPQIGFIGRRRLTEDGQPSSAAGSDDASGQTDDSAVDEARPVVEGAAPNANSTGVSEQAISSVASSIRWEGKLLDDPIQSFVGAFSSEFNSYMKAAEDALKRGEYYVASDKYDLAIALDPGNPLAFIGRGHALAAAGDYLSAVQMLERGIARFPQIAAFKIDLLTIAGRVDAYDLRRADLEARLELREDYKLRFLLGYLEVYSGLEERGILDLERAAKAAPADSIIAQFPGLLSGRIALPPLSGGR